MLKFAMECFWGAAGISLFLIVIKHMWRQVASSIVDHLSQDAALGLALYLMSRFVWGFFEAWGTWG